MPPPRSVAPFIGGKNVTSHGMRRAGPPMSNPAAQALPQSRSTVKSNPVECVRLGGVCENPSDFGDESRRARLECCICRAAVFADVRRGGTTAAPQVNRPVKFAPAGTTVAAGSSSCEKTRTEFRCGAGASKPQCCDDWPIGRGTRSRADWKHARRAHLPAGADTGVIKSDGLEPGQAPRARAVSGHSLEPSN
jgi:hypothetical protein